MLPSPVTLSYTPDIVYNSLLSLKWSVIIIYFYDYPRLLYFKDATTFRCYIYYHNVSNIRLLLVDVFVCVCESAPFYLSAFGPESNQDEFTHVYKYFLNIHPQVRQ